MEGTTWAQRRQGDTRAVTYVKPNEPREKGPDADTLEYVEGQEKAAAKGEAAGESGGVSGHGTCGKGRVRGTWEIHRGLGAEPSMPTERTIHRKADAAVEVGSLGSTPRAGKPRTWGSEGAGQDSSVGRHLLHAEAGPRCQRNY